MGFRDLDRLHLVIDEWTEDDQHCTPVAAADGITLALAAFKKVVEMQPDRRWTLRHGMMVIERHEPDRNMCNLYSHRKSQDELRAVIKGLRDSAGNLQPQPAIFPDGIAPVIRNTKDGPELIKMRWGIPGPAIYGGHLVTNVRNTKSGHWKPWLKPEQRCLVPATSFCEYNDKTDPKTKRKTPTWFALSDDRPLFFFAGIWREWTGTRGTKADPVEGKHLLFSFLTTDANAIVKPVHAKAMPVILAEKKLWEMWLEAPIENALALQRPLPAKQLKIVATGEKRD